MCSGALTPEMVPSTVNCTEAVTSTRLPLWSPRPTKLTGLPTTVMSPVTFGSPSSSITPRSTPVTRANVPASNTVDRSPAGSPERSGLITAPSRYVRIVPSTCCACAGENEVAGPALSVAMSPASSVSVTPGPASLVVVFVALSSLLPPPTASTATTIAAISTTAPPTASPIRRRRRASPPAGTRADSCATLAGSMAEQGYESDF